MLNSGIFTSARAVKLTSQFPQYRAAIARVQAGTGRARVIGIGPSNMRGIGAGVGSSTHGARQRSWFSKLAALHVARGIPASASAVMGASNGTGASIAAGDETALISAGGWTLDGNTHNSLGGRSWTRTTSNNTMIWDPDTSFAWDTVEIFDQQESGLGRFQYKIAAGSYSAEINSSSTTSALRKTIASSGTAATPQTLTINKSGGTGQVRIQGFIWYDSAVSGIDFVNMGWAGSSYANWLAGSLGYSPMNALASVAWTGQTGPDLAIIQMGLQEYITAGSTTSLTTNLESIITTLRGLGSDVLIVIPSPPDESAYADRPWLPYVQAMFAAGRSLDVPVLDTREIFARWAAENTYNNNDDVHYNESANVLIAAAVNRLLRIASE